MNEQPVVSWETPYVYTQLEDVPNIWVKRCGVYFTGADKKSFKTDPPLYQLEAVYEEVSEGTEDSEKITIFDAENFEPKEHWFRKLPSKGNAFEVQDKQVGGVRKD
jgi:hypothetical protein